MSKDSVLIVDDNPIDLRMIVEAISEDYSVIAVTSGEEALEAIERSQPLSVVADVNMAPMGGYELCEKIKKIRPGLPVVFLSASSDNIDILQGLDAGGDDYIVKPFSKSILLKKIAISVDQNKRNLQSEQARLEASKVAMTALTSASDMSIVVNFLRSAREADSVDRLAMLLNNAILDYGLNSSIMIKSEMGDIFHSSNSTVLSPLEKEILEKSETFQGRLLEHGRRLIVVFNSISVIVKNLPENAEARVGEIRDVLMIVVEHAYYLLEELTKRIELEQQKKSMLETIHSMQAYQESYKHEGMHMLDELSESIITGFSEFEISETQEDRLRSILDEKISQGLQHMEKGLEMDESFKSLIGSLGTI